MPTPTQRAMNASYHLNLRPVINGSRTEVNNGVAAKQLKVIDAFEALIEP